MAGCREPQFNDFFVGKTHALQLTEQAVLRTIAW